MDEKAAKKPAAGVDDNTRNGGVLTNQGHKMRFLESKLSDSVVRTLRENAAWEDR